MLNPRKLYNKKGFSLVELIIVVAIIAIISVASISIAPGLVEKARKSTASEKLSQVSSTIAATIAEGDAITDIETAKNGITAISETDDLNTLSWNGELKNNVVLIFYKGDEYVILAFYGKTADKYLLLDSRDATRDFEDGVQDSYNFTNS